MGDEFDLGYGRYGAKASEFDKQLKPLEVHSHMSVNLTNIGKILLLDLQVFIYDNVPMSTALKPQPVRGALLVLGSCISLQFGAAFAILLFPLIGVGTTTLYRLFFAGLILCVLLHPKITQWSKRQWRAVVLFGLALGSMNTFFYAGIDRLPLGTAVAIEFIGPLTLAACLSRSLKDFLWVAIAVSGIALFGVESALGISSLDMLGVVFVLAAGFFWALYILAAASASREVPGTDAIAMALLIGVIPTLPVGLGNVSAPLADPKLLAFAVSTAIFASLIPYTLEFLALQRVRSGTFGILMSMEPAVAAIAGFLLLGQRMGLLGILAICLVITASIGTTLSTRSKPTVTISHEDP